MAGRARGARREGKIAERARCGADHAEEDKVNGAQLKLAATNSNARSVAKSRRDAGATTAKSTGGWPTLLHHRRGGQLFRVPRSRRRRGCGFSRSVATVLGWRC